MDGRVGVDSDVGTAEFHPFLKPGFPQNTSINEGKKKKKRVTYIPLKIILA